MHKKIAITSDCVCDLSEDILEEYGVEVVYFYITTDHGCFKDMDEITSRNVVEYFEGGGRFISTEAPRPSEYERFFKRVLTKCDEIIHVTITSTLSASYEYATEAAGRCDGKVTVYDSKHLSTGIGHLVIKAAKLAEEGKNKEEIITALNQMKNKVSTSFIAENADYLYRTGRVSNWVRVVCSLFKIHPVLGIKNGMMGLKSIEIGNYERATVRYVRRELRRHNKIDKERLFITHSSCTLRLVSKVKNEIEQIYDFEQITETHASATISSNCGKNTLGVLFVWK